MITVNDTIRFIDKYTLSFIDPQGKRALPSTDCVVKELSVYANREVKFPLIESPISLFGLNLQPIVIENKDLNVKVKIEGSAFFGSITFELEQTDPGRYTAEAVFAGHLTDYK